MGDAYVDQGAIKHHVVGVVGDGLALAQVREVMHLHRLGLAFGLVSTDTTRSPAREGFEEGLRRVRFAVDADRLFRETVDTLD